MEIINKLMFMRRILHCMRQKLLLQFQGIQHLLIYQPTRFIAPSSLFGQLKLAQELYLVPFTSQHLVGKSLNIFVKIWMTVMQFVTIKLLLVSPVCSTGTIESVVHACAYHFFSFCFHCLFFLLYTHTLTLLKQLGRGVNKSSYLGSAR